MTRVLDYGNEANYEAAGGSKKAWPVYRRLVGYALRYKMRLAITLLCSVMVAASLTSIILALGASITILLDDEEKVDAQLEGYAEVIRDWWWAPEGLDERLVGWAHGMREDRARASAVLVLCTLVVVLSLVNGLARFLQEYLAGAIGVRVCARLIEEMFSNMVSLSHGFFESTKTGEVVARFTNDVFQVNKGLTNVFIKLVREPIKALFFLALALSVDVFLTLAVLLVLPPIIFLILTVGKRVKKSARRSLQRVAAMASVIQETVSGIAVVKSFRMEDYEKARIRREVDKLRRYLIRIARADAAVGPSTEFLMVLGVVTFVVLGVRQVSGGNLSPGELSMLFISLAMMLDPLRKLATVNNQVQASVASAERVFEFIDWKPDVVESPDAKALVPLEVALRFEDVHFAYDGTAEVLHGVDFEVKKGEMVALVGFSGAGKSTIAKLITRFYDPVKGRITIDGTDIRDATLASLRGQIGIVTQETILFHDTVRGNIAFGQTDFSDERVREAAEAAQAAEFVERLDHGYDTLLNEGGGNLSGGQRQRLSIARAIIKDPAILILDEATSSLDSESERAIQQAIAEFVVGRTTLVIAHRLSTIRRADRIVVIHEGRVAEEGTHEELLSRGGIYQGLYDVQFAPSKEPSTP